jgi:hypothetical protein
MRFTFAVALAVGIAALSAVSPADSYGVGSLEEAGRWGDRACDTGLNYPPRDAFAKTYLDDRFPASLAVDGRRLPTAGSGSWWVYDPAHHILAVSDHGDLSGARIFFCAAPPPIPLPVRNLANVVSAHGLRLGLPVARALAILGVSRSSLRTIAPGRSMVVARKNVKCSPYDCAHDNTIVFEAGRVIAISLEDVGP